jgi:hypothetical protein
MFFTIGRGTTRLAGQSGDSPTAGAAESSELIRQALFSDNFWKPATDFHLTPVGVPRTPAKQGATSAQGLHIDGLVIGFAILPAAIDDAQPFEGQGADRHLVRLVLIVAQVVIGTKRIPLLETLR